MAKNVAYHRITDLRGGMNNTDEPHAIADNQVVEAINIDWNKGTLGGKRSGAESISIDNSVVNVVPPVLVSTTLGGGTGSSSYSVNIPAISDDGTGDTYLALIVFISTANSAQNVTNVTYQGVSIAELAAGANGSSGRLELWGENQPDMAGGTLQVTAAGNCDMSISAQIWRRTSGIGAGNAATGTSTIVYNNGLTTNPKMVVLDGVSFVSTATATIGGFQLPVSNQTTNGSSRLACSYELGRSPSTLMEWALSGSVDWYSQTVALNGAPLSAFAGGNNIQALMRHTPTNNITEDELWIVTAAGQIDRRVGGSWQGGVPIVSQFVGIFDLTGLDVNGTSLHGKFFISASAPIDGVLCWDGTVLRFAGFPIAPPLPLVTTTGVAGSYTGVRYFRVRFVEQDSSGKVLRRSEPSPVYGFAGPGTDNGAVIAKGLDSGFTTEDFRSSYMNGQTHWEVEASLDGVLYYRIATVPIATATYTDTTPYSTTYSNFPLSDPIGQNTAPSMVRFVVSDQDRLIMGGDRLRPVLDSRVQWTPVFGDSGVGNDERVPTTTRNYVDCDGLAGGGLQALVAGESGNIYAFKWQKLYKLTRTGILEAAYQPYTESQTKGATKLGACSGQDEDGNPCVYFTDPAVGLCRVGKRGVEQLGENIQATWDTVTPSHPSLFLGPRLFYIPAWRQVWILAIVGGVSQIMVFNARFGAGGNGWSLYRSGLIGVAQIGGTMFPVDSTTLEPMMAISFGSVPLVRFVDGLTNDAGSYYSAYWTSKAYLLGGLFRRFGVMAANLYTKVNDSILGVRLIRNLGVGTRTTSTNLEATASEASATHVFRPVDDAFIRECFAIQLRLGDPTSFTNTQLDQTWTLNEAALKIVFDEEATS